MRLVFKTISNSMVAKVAGLGAAVALAASFVALSQAQSSHNLTVNVSDNCGPVVAEITIVQSHNDGRYGITDSNGQYTFDQLDEGIFYLHVAAEGHDSQDTGAIVLDSDQEASITLNRISGDCGGNTGNDTFVNLNFLVKNCSNEAVSNVAVNIDQDFGNGPNRHTDGNGFANFGVLNNRNIGWSVSSNQGNSNGSVNSGNGADVDVRVGNCGGTTPTPGTHNLTVNVSDACGPVVAEITIVQSHNDGKYGVTDGNGQFTFYNLDEGIFYLHVAADGRHSQDTDAIVFNSTRAVNVSLDRINGDCGGAQAPTFVNLNFLVKDNCDNAAVVDANVHIDQNFGNGQDRNTDTGGFANFGVYASTIINWSVSKHGFSNSNGVSSSGNSGRDVNVILNHNCPQPQQPQEPQQPTQPQQPQTSVSICPSGTLTLNQFHEARVSGKISVQIAINSQTSRANATLVNNTECTAPVSMSSYKMFDANLSTQELLDVTPSTTLAVNSTLNLSVAVATCATQVDVWYGDAPRTLQNITYPNVIAFTYHLQNQLCTRPTTTTPAPGTIGLTKNVRNITAGQSTFSNSVNANPGDQVEFRMMVTASNGAVSNVIFSDSLPARLTYINNSLTVDGTALGNTLGAVSLGNFNSGDSKTIVLRATVADSNQFAVGTSTLTNTANVTSNSNSASASASVNVTINPVVNTNTSITIVKTVKNITQGNDFAKSTNSNPGDQVQFRLVVSNTGSNTAQNVVVTDTMPGNISLASGNLTNNVGSMSAGSTQTFFITGTVSNNQFCGSNTATNNVSVTASNANTVSDTANVTITGNSCGGGGGSPFLAVTKQVRNVNTNNSFSNSTTAQNNETVQFRIVVSNTGNITTNNVRLTDSLPFGLAYVSGTFVADNGTSFGNLFGGNQFLGSLSSGQSRTVTFNALVQNTNTANQTLTNTATTCADNSNCNSASASVFVSNVAGSNINLVLSKRAWNQTRNVDATSVAAQPGDIIIYTLTVRNTGNAQASNFVIQDSLSDVLQLSGLQDFSDAAFNLGNLSLSWPQTTIPANGVVEKSFTVKVNASFPTNSDCLMTNTYGNVVNVRTACVKGVFTAPPTGGTTTAALVFALLTMVGYMGYRRYQLRTVNSYGK